MFKFFNRKKYMSDNKPTIVADHSLEVVQAEEDKNTRHLTLMHGLALHLQSKEYR